MDKGAQVFRTHESLVETLDVIKDLQERFSNVSVQDKGRLFNTDLLEAVELGFLIDLAEVVVVGALERKESRGGHFREDFPDRDDANYMAHTMAYRRVSAAEAADAAGIPPHETRLDTKPVVVTRYQPMERKY